jgi:hypothetical protein
MKLNNQTPGPKGVVKPVKTNICSYHNFVVKYPISIFQYVCRLLEEISRLKKYVLANMHIKEEKVTWYAWGSEKFIKIYGPKV